MKTFLSFALAIFMTMCLAATNAKAVETLKVLNWNVYMLPWPIKDSMQKQRSKLIAAAMANTDYDVMFFEEAFSKGFRKEMQKVVSKKYPYSYYLKSDGKIFHVFGSGLLVMSRRPFKVVDHVYYKTCSGADCFASKGALLIETTLASGRKIQFASTHLQASGAQGAKRMKQLGNIHDMLEEHRRPGVPQMLIGDLNITETDAEFEKGLDLFNMKPAVLTGPIQSTSGRKNDCYKIPGSSQRWIDHAWAKSSEVGAFASRVRDYTFESKGRKCPYSDHHAIEVRGELR